MRTKQTLLTMLLLTLLLPGCQSSARRAPSAVERRNSTEQVLSHPEFTKMAWAAPELTKRVLRIITEQDTIIANHGGK